MNVTTLNIKQTETTHDSVIEHVDAQNELPVNVISIRSARKAQENAKQELLDYLLWSMKHDMDPHRLYDDPIDVFRAELKKVVGVA